VSEESDGGVIESPAVGGGGSIANDESLVSIPTLPSKSIASTFINPLAFLEVDEPWATHLNKTTTPENILEYMCTPGVNSKVEGFVERYKEISREKTRLFAAPVEDRILEKLVWPLRHSKACYMAGNYLGAIALCGMVSEMVAILLYELSEFQINNRKMTSSDKKPFGEVLLKNSVRTKELKFFMFIIS